MLADLYAAFGHHAVNRREHGQTFVVDVGTAKCCFGRFDGGVALRGRTGDLCGRGFALLGRGFVGGLRLNQGIARLIVFLFAHCARADQFRAAIDRILCGLYRAACLAQLRIGYARAVECVLDLARGLRELRLRLAQGDLRVGRVEFDQHLTGFDLLVFIGEDGLDRADGLCVHHHHIAGNVGVVGAFVVARKEEPVGQPSQAGDEEQRDGDGQAGFAFALVLRVLLLLRLLHLLRI